MSDYAVSSSELKSNYMRCYTLGGVGTAERGGSGRP